MADIFSQTERSRVMAAVRSSGNKGTELKVAAMFRTHRVTGWRRGAQLFGRPDFVFSREKVAVFVDGCYWHGCSKHVRMPRSNREYWTRKIDRNRKRDRVVGKELRARGWRVVRLWEHALKMEGTVIRRVRAALEKK